MQRWYLHILFEINKNNISVMLKGQYYAVLKKEAKRNDKKRKNRILKLPMEMCPTCTKKNM
jgi:hypothetical protein